MSASITFLPLDVHSGYASGSHRRSLRTTGSTLAAGLLHGTHRRVVRSQGVAYAGALDIDPEVPAYGTHTLIRRHSGEAYTAAFQAGTHRRRTASTGYAGSTGAAAFAAGEHRRTTTSYGMGDADAGHGLLMAPPFHVSGYGGQWFETPRETFQVGAGEASLPVHVLRDITLLGEEYSGRIEAAMVLADAVALSAPAAVVLYELILDLVVTAPDAQYTYTGAARALERLLAAGAATGYVEAIAVMLDAMALRSLADGFDFEQVTDTAALTAAVADAYTAMGAVLDRLLTSPEAVGAQHLTAVVRDTVAFDPTTATSADLYAVLRDSLGLAAHLSLDTGEYVAWVVNTESAGTSTYRNYPFNSFASLGGRYYGATSQGLFLLEGEDDDGEAIDARIRLGLHDMNTRKLKRLPEAYIGYKSDGNLILRVIVADDQTGEKVALEYLMRPRAAPALRESRFITGRGVKAVDWDFEIENIDGADFDLAEVEFHPLIMDRRTRG